MRFSKWHALGNSYLVVEQADGGELSSERARVLCSVEHGIGADGVIEVLGTDGDAIDVRIWNPDGSTAEMSGNGTRIAARWLAARSGSTNVTVRVGKRHVTAAMLDGALVETDIGPVVVAPPETIDVHGNAVELTSVDVGNPHAVIRCEELSREVLLRLGPLIEIHARFPERTNVQLVHPESETEIAALVWERGAGETAASGSSAVAVAAVAVARGWSRSPVTVCMPGGDLLVRLEDGEATLVGPAEPICSGETHL